MLTNILLLSVAMLILFVSMEKPRICRELKGEAYDYILCIAPRVRCRGPSTAENETRAVLTGTSREASALILQAPSGTGNKAPAAPASDAQMETERYGGFSLLRLPAQSPPMCVSQVPAGPSAG